ncbi:4Fe-4S dicluster domain-containing protein [Paramaledivibacter caminithermalis]|jgi:[FeFe] hydrogenase (group B1/B3)|uniref:[FeFe] hydrogenase, group B1/B3 n=1 Tax=Paramaledivibacter caminithermalis (strain DSM 15212 / CIP 107654 / DViRD3) TaxID=1121301 RepID=A0A1M6TKG2_PARC5|nr:4Fe-4S dicluster domain-containing protein [Paramaledivibacter caminithermalis]SHK57451.1 [FeFe] hydrogenase, group B1/B3 [Paramaledivibacter caminithermalis DSM 15212]
MRKFENDVQVIKYEVLKEVAKLAMEGTLEEKYHTIPEKISPGPKPRTRCCVYKERAIIEERVKIARGGDKENKNNIEIISIACDECSINRYTVTEACRGCLAKWCHEACPVDAIYYVGHKAYINNNKCIECGRCKDVCPYNAISDVMRPCRKACEADALYIDNDKKAVIDNEKCVQCGACVYKCPFGAIMDKAYIVDVINLLKESKSRDTNVYAVIAPAISSQFTYVKIGQLVKGIKLLGFHDVIEVALGADIVAHHETKEFAEEIEEKKFITSSCCPAFVSYIEKKFPELGENISGTVSPMIAVSRLIKNMDKNAKVVFIGPCTAKKMEINRDDVKGSTDYVLTFEELTAMIDAAGIDLRECEEDPLDNASFFGRIFARTGGLTEAIKHVIEDEKIDVEFKPVICDGLAECSKALKIAKVNRLNGNFIEGMACTGGCIGGAASIHHGRKDRNEVDKYGKSAIEKNIKDSLRILDIDKLDLDR